MESLDTSDKYVTFNRDELMHQLQGLPVIPLLSRIEINDAVVIRRQDKFASPCLATYASMIALVAENHSDPQIKEELMRVADYFEDQAKLAADEGYKLPTP